MTQEVRFRDGVPIFDGTAELFERYRREAILYVETVEWRKRDTAAPRLISALEGPARVAAHTMPPGWFSHPKGVYALLDHLKASLRSPSLPEAGRYITKFFYGLKRKRGETMHGWFAMMMLLTMSKEPFVRQSGTMGRRRTNQHESVAQVRTPKAPDQ